MGKRPVRWYCCRKTPCEIPLPFFHPRILPCSRWIGKMDLAVAGRFRRTEPFSFLRPRVATAASKPVGLLSPCAIAVDFVLPRSDREGKSQPHCGGDAGSTVDLVAGFSIHGSRLFPRHVRRRSSSRVRFQGGLQRFGNRLGGAGLVGQLPSRTLLVSNHAFALERLRVHFGLGHGHYPVEIPSRLSGWSSFFGDSRLFRSLSPRVDSLVLDAAKPVHPRRNFLQVLFLAKP